MTTTRSVAAGLPAAVLLDRDGPLPCLRFPLLERARFARHAVTTRLGGVSRGRYAAANLGLSVGDDRESVLANRDLVGRLVSDAGVHPVTVRQVHGVTAVLARGEGMPGVPVSEGDMLATDAPGMPLLVQAADCVPLIVLDPVRRAVAVVHAGWRGTAAKAGGAAVDSMRRLFGSKPGDLLVALGPAIGSCCYEVSDEVAEAVVASCSAGDTPVILPGRGERPHIDLVTALIAQLRGVGVAQAHIANAGICTACRGDLFYSHRREGEPTGRFGALVCIDGAV
ncbi:MAG: peptidoglycan editing factor PgeF [Dehalococcoidia bacterium]